MNRVLNNEVLGLIAIQSVLTSRHSLVIANVYLIAPLLFDKKIRCYLKRKTTKILSVQELVTTKNYYFIGFNDKFTDSLVVTTNAIAMGIELNIFKMEGGYLVEVDPLPSIQKSIGRKVEDIVCASKNVAVMLSESPESLYSLLRLEI
ncbi:hypothetical protein AYY26_17795 [Photobacterium phosphoreum]|uniref:three component ABC system middle component n=1 Tax=Photobacterium phosphoreum TaxID=659 RepID=UPI0007F956EB|nr:three component ABC system middle component [Photobacterium phosphoreum]OBU44233.1 hypothetical protein AYY26_17795 [Photobacterium phosphoreum]